jgi:hypothetical protein
MTFDYFPSSHALSPFPTAIFKYDKNAGEYLPANSLFPNEVTKNLKKDLADVARLSRNLDRSSLYVPANEEYIAAALRVFLKYVYAGREPRAWAFFNAEYKLNNKQQLRSDLREKLRECSIYDYIYPRRKRNGN